MAFSLSITSKKVYGNDQVIHGVLSADGAAGAVATGLGILDMAHVTPKSAATGNANVKINLGATATSIAGTLAVTGVASGDEFYVTVYGR